MRTRHVVPFAAFVAGLTAATALHRRAARGLPVSVSRFAVPAAPRESVEPIAPESVRDGVVLPFLRPVPVAPAAEQPAAPTRCGDSGGRTKAGAPCAARATAGSRCRHHPIAA